MKVIGKLAFAILFLFLSTGPGVYAEESPDLEKMMDLTLEELLDVQVSGRGEAGSFGARLEQYAEGIKIGIHGYVTSEYINAEGKAGTFDQHYFNVFVSASLHDRVFAEIQFEYEHGGDEIQARYAQVDFKLHPSLILRTGKFLIPSGPFNEYLYPEYIVKTVNRPFANREISPTAWADVGVQVRGRIDMGELQPSYAFYVVNGLEGAEGDRIRGMRGKGGNQDKNHENKAVGGHVGLAYKGLEFGGSFYTGAYTPDGMMDITIAGIDAAYVHPYFTLRGEWHSSEQDITGGTIDKDGYYVQASMILLDHFEPVVQYDEIDEGIAGSLERDKQRTTVGLNYIVSNLVKVKVNYEIISDDGVDKDDNVIGVQLAMGF